MSATSQACKRLINGYLGLGHTEADAVEMAIDRVAHDVVFFMRNGNKKLEHLSRLRLTWLEDYKERVA